MKHAIISIVSVALIAIYSIFSFFYIDGFTKNIEYNLSPLDAQNCKSSEIEVLKQELENKKNVLLLMISKEHINKVEDSLTALEFAVSYESPQDIDTNKAMLQQAIDDINRHNRRID